VSDQRSAVMLDGYQLRLPSFEGPMDVLLSLIERERLDISELSLVAVTDGFLSYIESMGRPPAALLAEFAGIAARLLVLKSRAMLPRPPATEEDPSADDLAQQLREYQQMKLVAQALRETHEQGLRSFSRPPRTDTPKRLVFVAPPVSSLKRAFARSLSRAVPEAHVAPLRRIVTIGEMLDRITSQLSRLSRPRPFRELIGARDRESTIVGFIALLALWRRGDIDVRQDGLFTDIEVTNVGSGAFADD